MQSHADSEFNFVQGSNLILGDNASGKSAMRRGLKWVMENKPTGTSFIHWDYPDDKPCEVTIEYNSHVITRRRSRDSKINSYVLDGKTLTAFGAKVPDEVQAVFNMDDTNLEQQKAPYFLISESAPAIARRLNKLTNLESIDKAFTSVRGKKLESSRVLKDARTKLEDLDAGIESYQYLEAAGDLVTSVEEAIKQYSVLDKQYEDILNLAMSLEKAYTELKTPVPVTSDVLAELLDMFNTHEASYQALYTTLFTLASVKTYEKAPITLEDINTLLNTMDALQSDYIGLESNIQAITSVPILDKAPTLDINDVLLAVTAVNTEWNLLRGTIATVEKAQGDYEKLDASYQIAAKELKEIWPSICPLCGQPMEGECTHF